VDYIERVTGMTTDELVTLSFITRLLLHIIARNLACVLR